MIKRIHLGTGVVSISPVEREIQRHFVGGLGLCVRLMAEVPDPALPALDPDLPLIVAGGPLNATGFPSANRTCFFGVSPLTGLMAGSWMGGSFGTGLMRSHTAALIIQGRADQPSILIISEQRVELTVRSDLWGLTVSETRELLEREYDTPYTVAVGPAGERLVPMASIFGEEGHAAGRCGLGAVMGAKNLKAIVAVGENKPSIVDQGAFKAAAQRAHKAVRGSSFLQEVHSKLGTNSLVKPINEFEALPTGNHQRSSFSEAEQICGERIAEAYIYKQTTCAYCPVRCRFHVRFGDEKLHAPEYETVWAFGADNEIAHYELIAHANQLCNELGLDTISAGNTIAFYREYTGTMHDPSNVLPLIEQLADREGPGEILAQGTRYAARHFDVDYAMQVKGLELPAYDPRKMIGMAIGYATSNRGGCHCRVWTVSDELSGIDLSGEALANMVVAYQDAACVRDSLITCNFVDMTIESQYAPALTAVTGHTFTDSDLKIVGERIFTLERMLNVRRGVDASYDVLPRRIMEGLTAPAKYHEGMDVYYDLRGWDAEGHPSAGKLEALGLSFLR